MITLSVLLAKVFLFGIFYFLLTGLVNVILANLSRLFLILRGFILIYSIIVTLIYVYIYSFWGAYLKSIVVTYSEIYDKKWLLIVLCFISIYPWLKFTNPQLKEARREMEAMTGFSFLLNPSHQESTSNQEAYMQSITVIALSMIIILPISFVVFLFTNTLL